MRANKLCAYGALARSGEARKYLHTSYQGN